jgi:hypothetical protein
MSYPKIIQKLNEGLSIALKPKGQSMTPLIESGQRIVLSPIGDRKVKIGDVVLAKVNGKHFFHLVTAVDEAKDRVQISNNHGWVNGWTGREKVFGIVTEIG